MGILNRDGYNIFYKWYGKKNGQVIILSHSLGANMEMWKPQLAEFSKHFRILLYDHPGHGKSSKRLKSGEISDYGQDVLALMDTLGINKPFFCGLSLGGMVGIWLGAMAGNRFKKIVICNTAAKIENTEILNSRISIIKEQGIGAIAHDVIKKWFTKEYIKSEIEIIKRIKKIFLTTSREGYIQASETVCRLDLYEELDQIDIPVLVVYGINDLATPPKWNEFIIEKVKHSVKLKLGTGHLSNIEAADEFNKGVIKFLS